MRIEHFDLPDLDDMKTTARRLYISCSLYNNKLSPSMWALTNCAPIHAGKTLHDYSLGLGINSMEGREQKHQKIVKYSDKTTFHNRCSRIFRHEYIDLIYLRENGFDKKSYYSRGKEYTPVLKDGHCKKCDLVINDDICNICDNVLMTNHVNEKMSLLSKKGVIY